MDLLAQLPEGLTLRRYEPSDRPDVRWICCETADAGGPVERFFNDREFFADFVTRYYTDHEPEALWVVEVGGRVGGYLTGCLDTRRYRRIFLGRILPRICARALGRGTFFRPQVWRFLAREAKRFFMERLRRGVVLERYPAHFHINLLQPLRRRQLGRLLVRRFLRQAEVAGVRGVHLVTRADNHSARRFFERCGFEALTPRPAEGSPHGIVYGRQLS